jgi:hypothetical protein
MPCIIVQTAIRAPATLARLAVAEHCNQHKGQDQSDHDMHANLTKKGA